VTRRALLLAAIFAVALPHIRADELTRKVQEALRTRELYYGEVDGVRNPETSEAVRRFQEKKGIDPTGALDDATLHALGLLPPAASPAPGAIHTEQARDFIDRYLHACQSNDPDIELAFYAGRVNYMDEGAMDKSRLRTELAAYRKNWPDRHFKLLHCVASASPSKANEIIVTFRYQFVVRGGGHEQKGIEDLNAVIAFAGGEPGIISLKEF
jgi:hypothetical protein